MTKLYLLLFFILGVSLVGVALLISYLFHPKSTNPQKAEPYECGIKTHGPSWVQFNVGYYLFAILFLIFDVDTVFIFPWAVVMKDMGVAGLVEILIFFVVLGLGLLYGWKKGALKWE